MNGKTLVIIFLMLVIAGLLGAILMGGSYKPTDKTIFNDEITMAEGNPVVAKLQGKKITRNHVLEYIIAASGGQPTPAISKELFYSSLDKMLRQQLVLDEAYKNDVLKREDVRQQIDEAVNRVLISAYAQQLVEEKLTDEMLRERYDSLANAQQGAKERHARHILVADEAAAKSIITKLDGGADFAELAKSESTGPSGQNGGDLGYFTPDRMVPEFSQVAFTLPVGSYSKEPVKTQFGWHIIKVEDEREVSVPQFEQIKQQLKQAMSQQALNEAVDELVAKVSIETIDIFDEPVVPDQPAAPSADIPADNMPVPAETDSQSQ